jgi:hypothetical protein
MGGGIRVIGFGLSDGKTCGILLSRRRPKASWPKIPDHRICTAYTHTDHLFSSSSVPCIGLAFPKRLSQMLRSGIHLVKSLTFDRGFLNFGGNDPFQRPSTRGHPRPGPVHRACPNTRCFLPADVRERCGSCERCVVSTFQIAQSLGFQSH